MSRKYKINDEIEKHKTLQPVLFSHMLGFKFTYTREQMLQMGAAKEAQIQPSSIPPQCAVHKPAL